MRHALQSGFTFALAVYFAIGLTAVADPLPLKAPVPANNPMSAAKIELGKKLYFDPRISIDGTISCNSCHNVMGGGDDGRAFSAGVRGQKGGRSAPTVWNSAFMSVQFWDGRAASLEKQAEGPMINAVEMGSSSHDLVVGRIRKIPGYVEEFKKVYGKDAQITLDGMTKAIAAYERTLITPNSPYDQYMKGNKKAISAAAIRGLGLTKSVGCVSCHMGPNFAGPMLPEGTGFYQKFPVIPGTDYEKKYGFSKDLGRFEATKADADKNFWRVPTWRNIALTAPYFHNGSVKTLDEAVKVMAKTQLNRDLKDNEASDIVAFLETLTGQFPEQKMPRLHETRGVSVAE